jgi:hypothetical protein
VCQHKTHGKEGHLPCILSEETAKETREIPPTRETLVWKKWRPRKSGGEVACRCNNFVKSGEKQHVAQLFAVCFF